MAAQSSQPLTLLELKHLQLPELSAMLARYTAEYLRMQRAGGDIEEQKAFKTKIGQIMVEIETRKKIDI